MLADKYVLLLLICQGSSSFTFATGYYLMKVYLIGLFFTCVIRLFLYLFVLLGLPEGTAFGDPFMVAIGSKALPLRKPKAISLTEDNFMAGEENHSGKRGKKGSMSRKSSKKHPGFDGHHSTKNFSGGVSAKTAKASKVSKHQIDSGPQTSFLRFL